MLNVSEQIVNQWKARKGDEVPSRLIGSSQSRDSNKINKANDVKSEPLDDDYGDYEII